MKCGCKNDIVLIETESCYKIDELSPAVIMTDAILC